MKKKTPAKKTAYRAEGGALRNSATISGRDRVAPMAAADEIASGKARRSGSQRGFGERAAAAVNAFASGKSGQNRSENDSFDTRAKNQRKK